MRDRQTGRRSAGPGATGADPADRDRDAPVPDPFPLSDATATADARVAAVRDDPVARLRLAAIFYRNRTGGRTIEPYQRAELAFMHWQIRRGVLAAADAERPGSPWWRAVNETLLRDTVEARLLFDGASGAPSTPGARHWVAFLRRPTPEGWYRAHNASIVAGYLNHRGLVDVERLLERLFMDVALLRVLYAHSLLAHPRFALGRLSVLAPLLGDPRRRAADLFLSMQNVLPAFYPLTVDSVDEVLADENYFARIFDYGVIAPRIESLYRLAAHDLAEPGLADLQDNGSPVYAWPAEHRGVWASSRSRVGIAVVGRILGRRRAMA